MLGLLILALAGTFLTGCANNRIARLQDVPSAEAIVVAKFRILYNGEDVTKGSVVIFNPLPPVIGTAKYQYVMDDSGYVFGTQPVGLNSINTIMHRTGLMQHRFKKDELTCQLAGGGVINYLGDITIDWNGHGKGFGVATAAVSPIFNALVTGGGIAVAVDQNVAAAQEAVRQKFGTDRLLTPALLVVKPAGQR